MKESGSVVYAGRRIDFVVSRTERKRLTITVRPDLSVEVMAPMERGLEEIEARVRRRAPWVTRQLEEFERFLPAQPARRYVTGESHRYLGRQYRLRVEREANPGAKLKGRYLVVAVIEPNDTEEVRSRVESWYRERAREIFQRHLDEALRRLARNRFPVPALKIRRMKRRWGSFTGGGAIILNPDLIKAPTPCIEYVVIHELCHSRHPNHGRAFENLLTRCLPDWKERKARLESLNL